MTRRRPVRSIAPSQRTTGQQIEVRLLNQHDAEKRRDDQAHAGQRPHPVDPADPYAPVEWRPCEPGCGQHGGAA